MAPAFRLSESRKEAAREETAASLVSVCCSLALPHHCQTKKRSECEFKPGTWKPLVSVGAGR